MQLSFLTMAIINYPHFTSVSGLPTAAKKVGVLADGNKTNWKHFSPTGSVHRHKRAIGFKSYDRVQLIQKLNKLVANGADSHGGYNGRYMAFTREEADKFPTLVSTVSRFPLRTPRRATNTTCLTSYNRNLARMCNACPTVTFLGHDRIPSYINEVTCGQQIMCKFGAQVIGECQNVVSHQTFLYKTGRLDPKTGYEEILPYTQSIRVACECMVFKV